MRVGSLFSGIGGIELGFERAGGFETMWFVEWDEYAQAVLRKHWPGTPVYGDIRSIDWETVAPVEVLTGGFPCQPHSVAGKRQASNDDRDLWPECRRAIAALKPKVCCFENVPGLLTSEKGEFFKRIIDDFYNLGYRPRVYRISARAVGAPHLRKRVFIVAYPDGDGLGASGHGEVSRECRVPSERQAPISCSWEEREHEVGQPRADVANPSRAGQLREKQLENDCRSERENKTRDLNPANDPYEENKIRGTNWAHADSGGLERPSEEERGAGNVVRDCGETSEGIREGWWAVEPDVGRVAYGVPSRVDRIKCLGNAVVPQVAQVIAEIIKREASQ